jgi:hypothetical protein
MRNSAEKSSTTTSPTITQAARQPFVARAGRGNFFAPARSSVQPKMTVNERGDKFEQEADKMADKVMRMPAPPVAAGEERVQRQSEEKLQKREEGEEEKILRAAPDDKVQKAEDARIQKAPAGERKIPLREEEKILRAASPDDKVQKAENDNIQKAPAGEQKIPLREEEKILRAASPDDTLQKAEDEKIYKATADDQKLQRREEEKILRAGVPAEQIQKAQDNKIQQAPVSDEALQHAVPTEGASAVGSDVQSAIRNKTTGGEPLSSDVRDHMEPRFNADFSNVRVHSDAESASLNNRLGARAFTYQNHIFFSRDQYQPGSSDGKQLLAHELTHTIQQGHSIQRSPQVSATTTPPTVQRWGLQDALDRFAEWAYNIPGFRMLTLVLGFNPVNMRSADRNAANLLRALIELLPGGAVITQALDNHGVINKAAAWVEQKLAALGDIGSDLAGALRRFLDSLSWTDIADIDGVWERAKRIFTEPIARLISFAGSTAVELLGIVKDAVLKPLAALAQGTRGYDLLRAILGEDPISGEPVPRCAENLLGGFMKLIGQEEIWENIKKGDAIARAWAWFQGALEGLMGLVRAVPRKIVDTLKSLTFQDIITVAGAFGKIVGAFVNIAGDFISWGLTTTWNLLEIIFDVVKPGLTGYIKKTGAALKSILKNPMPFLGNLVRAAKLGFTNFADHFGEHLKAGLIDWLTGSLEGVYIPKALSLPELGKFALSVLGITWAQIRGKIVKVLGPNGETIMKGLETGFDIVVALVKGGTAAAWELIKEKLNDLKDTVIGGIVDFVTDTIVKKAIPKLIGMFIPGAGFIPAIISIYDTIMVFVQKISKIIQVVTAFIDSIVTIAAGNITAAANRVESILGGLLSLAISFLAGFLGLGKVTDKIMAVIQKVRASVDKAIDAAIAWIVAKAKALFAKLFGKKDGKPDDRTEEQKDKDKLAALAEAQKLLSPAEFDEQIVRGKLPLIKERYKLLMLDLIVDSTSEDSETVHFVAAASNGIGSPPTVVPVASPKVLYVEVQTTTTKPGNSTVGALPLGARSKWFDAKYGVGSFRMFEFNVGRALMQVTGLPLMEKRLKLPATIPGIGDAPLLIPEPFLPLVPDPNRPKPPQGEEIYKLPDFALLKDGKVEIFEATLDVHFEKRRSGKYAPVELSHKIEQIVFNIEALDRLYPGSPIIFSIVTEGKLDQNIELKINERLKNQFSGRPSFEINWRG